MADCCEASLEERKSNSFFFFRFMTPSLRVEPFMACNGGNKCETVSGKD